VFVAGLVSLGSVEAPVVWANTGDATAANSTTVANLSSDLITHDSSDAPMHQRAHFTLGLETGQTVTPSGFTN